MKTEFIQFNGEQIRRSAIIRVWMTSVAARPVCIGIELTTGVIIYEEYNEDKTDGKSVVIETKKRFTRIITYLEEK